MSEDNSTYLNRAENLYMDSQDPESNPDPNTDANFIQLVTNGIKDFTIRRLVRDKWSKTFNELRDNWRRAVADFEIDQGMGDTDTQNISELKKDTETGKQPKVFACYTCQSTSHRYKECPKAATLVKALVQKELKKKGKGGGGGGKKGGRGGKRGKGGSFSNNPEKSVKSEPKN